MQAALEFGFKLPGLRKVIAVAVPSKGPSLRVVRRLGMARDPACDLDHPRVEAGHPLQRHVLYRTAAPA